MAPREQDPDHARRVEERRRAADERRREAEREANNEAKEREARARALEGQFAEACVDWGWAIDVGTLVTVGTVIGGGLMVAGIVGANVTGAPPLGGSGEAASLLLTLLVVVCAVAMPVLVRAMLMPRVRRAAAAERAWIESLPFHLERVADVYADPGSRLDATVKLTQRAPEACERAKRLAAQASIELDARLDGSDSVRLSVRLPSRSVDWRKARDVRWTVHDLVGDVLVPLADEHRVERVTLTT